MSRDGIFPCIIAPPTAARRAKQPTIHHTSVMKEIFHFLQQFEAPVEGRAREELTPEQKALLEALASGAATRSQTDEACRIMRDNSLALETFATLMRGGR
jgi:hypothetical protein